MPKLTRISAALALAIGTSAAADPHQQVVGPVPPSHFMAPMPVDQGVSDLDPLSASLRRLEPGNAMYSNRVRLTELPGTDSVSGLALPQRYRYSAPGIQAMFNQPDYYVRTGPGRRDIGRNVSPRPDGAIIERVPAGTVYDLRPEVALRHLMPDQFQAPSQAQTPPDWQDRRVDHRYRVDTRVGQPATGQAIDRQRNPHIPPDTEMPTRIERRFEPEPPPTEATQPQINANERE